MTNFAFIFCTERLNSILQITRCSSKVKMIEFTRRMFLRAFCREKLIFVVMFFFVSMNIQNPLYIAVCFVHLRGK